ncbi:hypothetical protein C8R43DRAFT_906629, partial [Mycena crocata]
KTRKHYSQLILEMYRGVWEETQCRMAYSRPSNEIEHGPWNPTIRDKWRELVATGSLPLLWRRRGQAGASPSTPTIAFAVARRLVLRHWLLVFDEIQLLDISSATLLADVLSWYWRMGGVIVRTSNKTPDEIYKHGVQRERLEPFVEALKVRCPLLTMRAELVSLRQTLQQFELVPRLLKSVAYKGAVLAVECYYVISEFEFSIHQVEMQFFLASSEFYLPKCI